MIVNAPLVHLGGLFRVLQAVLDGRRIALLERFTVDGWADAVRQSPPEDRQPRADRPAHGARRRRRPRRLWPACGRSCRAPHPSIPTSPTRSPRSTGCPCSRRTQRRSSAAGSPAGTSPTTGSSARSSGGASGGPTRGAICESSTRRRARRSPPTTVGLLEVRAAQLRDDDWIRTTDLARIDDDGFLWIVGRADQTILRGGIKMQPDVVRSALERHPAVRGRRGDRRRRRTARAGPGRRGRAARRLGAYSAQELARAPAAHPPRTSSRPRCVIVDELPAHAVGQGRARRCARAGRDPTRLEV